jgi:serine/threonine kinase 32
MGNAQGKKFDPNSEGNTVCAMNHLNVVSLMHFNLLRCVGRGAFGKVRIIERKDSKKVYALKYINKRDCIRMEALRNIFRERNILERVDHPYVCNLRFAFQDDENMYMALDLMMGGDLRFHLERRTFGEDVVRVWIAELSSAINYLHAKDIVHRDIKPDNVLMDEYGHVHLTDFNIATQYEPGRPLISESGTCVYMAPEMFGGRGYLHQVDWWALGICMYECIYGKRPFDGDSSEKVKKKIKNDPIPFPIHMKADNQIVSTPCIQVMKGFLERDRDKRLCCGEEGWLQLRETPWFDPIDWKRIEKKQFPPAFVPDNTRANFDASHDLEEMLLEQSPLEAKPRKKNVKLSKEMEMIERKFRSFDYLLYEKYNPIVDPVKMTVSDPPEWVKCVDPKAEKEALSQQGNGGGPKGDGGGGSATTAKPPVEPQPTHRAPSQPPPPRRPRPPAHGSAPDDDPTPSSRKSIPPPRPQRPIEAPIIEDWEIEDTETAWDRCRQDFSASGRRISEGVRQLEDKESKMSEHHQDRLNTLKGKKTSGTTQKRPQSKPVVYSDSQPVDMMVNTTPTTTLVDGTTTTDTDTSRTRKSSVRSWKRPSSEVNSDARTSTPMSPRASLDSGKRGAGRYSRRTSKDQSNAPTAPPTVTEQREAEGWI